MQDPLPPLGWLRAFEAAARHLSFTAAAHDLNMTQSAVSQQIKSLEAHLGRALFHRRHRALELTEAGRTFQPVVREAFATLVRGTRAVVGTSERVVNVHANMSFALYWLAPRLPRFRAQYPEVRLNILAEIWEPTAVTAPFDVEIRFSLQRPEGPQAVFLAQDHYYPVCAPGFDVTRETLFQAPLYDCTNLLSNWPNWAEQNELPWPDAPVTYASTYSFCLSLVLAGGGVMLGHDMICRDLLDQGRLVLPVAETAAMAESYHLIVSQSAAETREATLFADWLQAELAAFQSGRDATQA